MNENIKKLWNEKLQYDQHPEDSVLQAKEWDSIAKSILGVSKESTTLTAEDMEAVNWAKARLGV